MLMAGNLPILLWRAGKLMVRSLDGCAMDLETEHEHSGLEESTHF